MTLNHIVQNEIPHSVVEDYDHYKARQSMFHPRKVEWRLLEFGYKLMREAWRPCLDDCDQYAVGFAVGLRYQGRANIFGLMMSSLSTQQKRVVLDGLFPIREYDGLVSDNMGIGIDYRNGSFLTGYFSPGGIPRVNVSELLGILNRDAVNVFQYYLTWSNMVGLPFDQTLKLYLVQEKLLDYEHKLDKLMARSIRRATKRKVPDSLTDIDTVFSSAFRTAVRKLGGIDKYMAIREKVYKAYQEVVQHTPSILVSVHPDITLGHFRRLNDRKLELLK